MKLHLIRHADAGRGSRSPDDHLRALSSAGREQCAALRATLDRLGARYGLLLHSPWTRARQTAEALATLASEVEEEPALAAPPGEGLVNRLRGGTARRVALVGHEPWMGQLAALLLTGDPSLGDRFPFKKGGLYAIDWPDPTELRLVLTPALYAGAKH